jgi:hypothetical protein
MLRSCHFAWQRKPGSSALNVATGVPHGRTSAFA